MSGKQLFKKPRDNYAVNTITESTKDMMCPNTATVPVISVSVVLIHTHNYTQDWVTWNPKCPK
jgi:hypothetical protein